MWIGHCKEIWKLLFWARALRQRESRNCRFCVVYIQKDGTTLLVGAWYCEKQENKLVEWKAFVDNCCSSGKSNRTSHSTGDVLQKRNIFKSISLFYFLLEVLENHFTICFSILFPCFLLKYAAALLGNETACCKLVVLFHLVESSHQPFCTKNTHIQTLLFIWYCVLFSNLPETLWVWVEKNSYIFGRLCQLTAYIHVLFGMVMILGDTLSLVQLSTLNSFLVMALISCRINGPFFRSSYLSHRFYINFMQLQNDFTQLFFLWSCHDPPPLGMLFDNPNNSCIGD